MGSPTLLEVTAGESSLVLSLVLTYLMHAVVWTVAAALCHRSKSSSFAARHGCWKAALFGPLLSAALATAWTASDAPSRDGRGASLILTPRPASSSSNVGLVSIPPRWLSGVEVPVPLATRLERSLVWLIPVASGVGLLRFGVALLLLQRHLKNRRPAADPRLLSRFDRLGARLNLRRLRLTECDELASPLVIGAREVCVPSALHSRLSDADLEVVLAHELAHLERGDGIWFPLVGALRLTLWFQPLNHVAWNYFRRSAELSCDDRAVELTQNPTGLARAIVQMAEHAAGSSGALLAPTMACPASELLPRVRRLTAGTALEQRVSRAGEWPRLASVACVGVALVAVRLHVARARPTAPPPDASPRPVVTTAGTAGAPSQSWSPHPGPTAQSARLAELAAEERRVSTALDELSRSPASHREGTPEAVRSLELEQELHHVRAMQVWLEQEFVAEWATGERR